MRRFVILALAAVAAAPNPSPVPKTEHPSASHAQPAPAPKAAESTQPQTRAEPPGPPPLLAALPASAPGEKLRELLLEPYAAATRTALPALTWDDATALKALLAGHGADLILLDGATLTELCRSQAVIKLDWSLLDRSRTAPGAASDCGAGAYLDAMSLAWDKNKFQGTPDWADFWDIARHPGRRGLQGHARGNLEIALLADGVPPGDIYRTLRTADGLDRAFRKLDQLKPYIVWWNKPAEAADLIISGKALLTSAPIEAIAMASPPRVSLGYALAGTVATWFSWAVPQAAPHPGAALLALVIAADPARQADLARATGLGPATAPALDLLPPALRAHSPGLPVNQTLIIDETFWAESKDKIEARFASWLTK
jgi:putative spermidine/putrescine transport system substrate-binding protein